MYSDLGFLLDGKDPPKKVGCRKRSYFLDFVNIDVARDFVGVVFHVLLMVPRAHITTGTVIVLSPTSISKSLYLIVKLFHGFG